MVLILINNNLTITSQISNEILFVVVYSCSRCTYFIIFCVGVYFVCYDSYPLCYCYIMVFLYDNCIRMYFNLMNESGGNGQTTKA
jgi:hypothetical protein